MNEVKRSAKRRCISYELDDDVAKKMFLDRCHYCGGRGRGKILNGIDRVNNSLGYVEGNVVTACGPHNLMKHTMTHMEFLEQCRKVAIEHPATL